MENLAHKNSKLNTKLSNVKAGKEAFEDCLLSLRCVQSNPEFLLSDGSLNVSERALAKLSQKSQKGLRSFKGSINDFANHMITKVRAPILAKIRMKCSRLQGKYTFIEVLLILNNILSILCL